MAAEKLLEPLKNKLALASTILQKDLTQRTSWGEINFEESTLDFNRAKALVSQLEIMPLEYLADETVQQIQAQLDNLNTMLTQVDNFKITDNVVSAQRSLNTNVHSAVDQFFKIASPWVPYLAYQRGDVTQNINELSGAVKRSNLMIGEAEKTIKGRIEEIEKVSAEARAAAAKAGAAHFTQDFKLEADALSITADKWLKVGAGLAISTILAALGSLLVALNNPAMPQSELIQVLTAKLIILSVLFTATIWAGGMYKATKHQAAVNKHRALSLLTFTAFTAAASDEQTKNAVLLETTRSIFSIGATGYLDSRSHEESPMKVIEILKSLKRE